MATIVAAAGALAAFGAGSSVAAASSPLPATTARSASCPLPTFGPGDRYRPRIRPKDFSPDVTNPYFPLKPGRTLVYTGTKDGKKALNIVLTTSRTKVIDGVRTRIVEDRLYLDNVQEERTSEVKAKPPGHLGAFALRAPTRPATNLRACRATPIGPPSMRQSSSTTMPINATSTPLSR